MILLDTNVLSELMRPAPDPVVLAWLDRYDSQSMFISAITEAEILRGIALLPEGKRRTGLAEIAATLFTAGVADRRLPFDSAGGRLPWPGSAQRVVGGVCWWSRSKVSGAGGCH